MTKKAKAINSIIIGFCLYCLTGCQGSGLSPEDYRQWVEDKNNSLLQNQTQKGYQFSLQYEPLDYIVVKEQQEEPLTKEVLDTRRKELAGYVYFNLSILDSLNKNAFSNDSIFNSMYCQFDMQYDLKLINSKNDTMDCSFYQYENHGGVNPDVVLLGFEDIENSANDGFTLLYKASTLGLGNLTFKFSKESLQAIPSLKTR